MKFIKDHLLLLILVLVVAAGCFGGYRYYKAKQAAGAKTVKTAAVQYGELRKTVSATGSLSAIDNVDISSKITGRIVQVNVAENDHVTAGQLLVKLDETSLKQTELQKKAQMEDCLLTLNRDQALLDRGAIAQQTYDTALMNYKVAKALTTRPWPTRTIPTSIRPSTATSSANRRRSARPSAPVSARRRSSCPSPTWIKCRSRPWSTNPT